MKNETEVNVKLVDFLKAAAALLLALAASVEAEESPAEPEAEEAADDLLGTAAEAPVDDMLDTPAPEPVKPAKPAKAAKPAAAPVQPPAPVAVNPEQQLADLRAAAVEYAKKHGREKLRTLLNGYTKGNLPDIAVEKRAEVLGKLKA